MESCYSYGYGVLLSKYRYIGGSINFLNDPSFTNLHIGTSFTDSRTCSHIYSVFRFVGNSFSDQLKVLKIW